MKQWFLRYQTSSSQGDPEMQETWGEPHNWPGVVGSLQDDPQ